MSAPNPAIENDSSATATAPTPTTASTKRDRSPTPSDDTDSRATKRVNLGKETAEGEESAATAAGDMDANANAEGEGAAPMQVDVPASGGNGSLSPPPTPSTNQPPGSAAPVAAAGSTASAGGASATSSSTQNQTINMRCLIVTQDASVLIGKQGRHIAEIRAASNARVNISDSIPGNPERILSVQGGLDVVAKAFGLVVRRINDEPFDSPSLPGSRPVTIKFMIPNSRMGSVIGKGGSKIKEIQEASGARLNASEAMLPGSTERILSVSGVADAVHIAVYYIGTILLEYQGQAGGDSGKTASYRQSGASGAGAGAPRQPGFAPGPGAAVQQFWIPNDLVGSIIGKAGIKINEVRTQSQCVIRVTDPGTPAYPGGPVNENERLVIISGQPNNMSMAIGMLHSRLEAEKAKKTAEMPPASF